MEEVGPVTRTAYRRCHELGTKDSILLECYGKQIGDANALGPAYWRANLESPVLSIPHFVFFAPSFKGEFPSRKSALTQHSRVLYSRFCVISAKPTTSISVRCTAALIVSKAF